MHGDDDSAITTVPESSGHEIIKTLPRSALQALYYEVTGKTETLFKGWEKKVVIEYGDLYQLKEKVRQQIEIHDVIGPTITVEVSHEDSEGQLFSSWEKFAEYDISRTSPIGEITIKIEFLVRLPKIEKHHRYTVEIGIRSDLVDTPTFFKGLPKRIRIGLPTARCKIEYVDYIVAKGFLAALDSWIDGLNETHTPYHFPFLQDQSVHFRFLFLRLGYIASAVFALLSSNWFFINGSASLNATLNWAFTGFVVASVTSLIAFVLAEYCEYLVDNTDAVSCIRMNKGDEKRCIAKFSQNKKMIWRAACAFGVFLIAVATRVWTHSVTQ